MSERLVGREDVGTAPLPKRATAPPPPGSGPDRCQTDDRCDMSPRCHHFGLCRLAEVLHGATDGRRL